jgi:alpha-L-arabinofuranosidase
MYNVVQRYPGDRVTSTIDVRTDQTVGTVHPHIYGHFLEQNFFGNIEGGVFDEGSELADPETGFRTDVLAACRELGVPLVRWPGGNFTSAYHWTDGIGPRDARPRRLDLTWGGEESNRFGTDEFLAWCAAAGAEPFLVHSCRSVDDAVRWVEYTNHAGDTELTRQRAANGHPEPYPVRYWGVGNEVYGPWQMGYRPAEQYAADLREHARFMRAVDPDLRLVAVGSHLEPEHWARQVLTRAGGFIDYLSIHLYAAGTHLYTGDDYDAIVAQPAYFERKLTAYADLVHELAGELGIDRPLSLAMDEWNIRHLEPEDWPEPQRGAGGGTAERELPEARSTALRVNRYSPRTLADALFYAGVFHAMLRLSGHPVAPRMANTVNLTNANALLEVRPEGVVRSASYHVWDLYQNHTGPEPLAATVHGPARTTALRLGDDRRPDGSFRTVPAAVNLLDVSPTRSADGRTLHVAVINRSATEAITARLDLDGAPLPATATARTIGAGAGDLFAANSISEPDAVALGAPQRVEPADGAHTFPAHSITLLDFALTR